MPAMVLFDGGGTRATSLDVGAEGVRVLADRVVPLGTMVHLQVTLPEDGAVEMQGVVLRLEAAPREDGRAELVIRLTALDNGNQERWTAFLAECAAEDAVDGALDDASQDIPGQPLNVEIVTESMDTLLAIYGRQLANGGLMLDAVVDRPVGSVVQVTFVHPLADVRFSLRAKVLRAVEHRGRKGTLVTFEGLDLGWKLGFLHFIGGELPVETAQQVLHWQN